MQADDEHTAGPQDRPRGSALEVLWVAGRLGLTSFGGPVAHLGFFREEYVNRRRWLSDAEYADVVALCQALPGPASSQTGIAIGILRAGLLGGFFAWIGFTLPSAIAMIAFAFGVDALGDVGDDGWLHGLKVAAVAVVAFALWGMARSLTPDLLRRLLAVAAALAILLLPSALTQVAIIAAAGVLGWLLLRSSGGAVSNAIRVPISRGMATAAWVVFFVLLFGLPALRQLSDAQTLAMFDSFYRVGALVFGGGHVVLPLLEQEVVNTGWVTKADFLAGYGAAQAVPGPLFTFAGYLGASSEPRPSGVAGGSLALVAIFLPSFLLVIGGLPLWGVLRSAPAFQAALRGVNAGVVGLLLAALYDPVWTSAIFDVVDLALGLVCFVLLYRKAPPWAVVIAAALAGAGLAAI